jgi:predicted phage-related endonuclease
MNAFDEQKPKVELPLDTAAWIELYRKTQSEIKALEEKLEQAKAKIQEAMGDNEVGLLEGRVAVRWTKVTSVRLDVAKAKEILDPKIYGFLSRESTSRRFTLVEPDVNN